MALLAMIPFFYRSAMRFSNRDCRSPKQNKVLKPSMDDGRTFEINLPNGTLRNIKNAWHPPKHNVTSPFNTKDR